MTTVGTGPTRDQHGVSPWKVGAGMATLAAVAVNTKSMYSTPLPQRAILTVLAGGAGFAVGALSSGLAHGVDAATPLDGAGSLLAVAGASGLTILGTVLALRSHPDAAALHIAKSVAQVVGGGAVVGGLLLGEQAVADKIAPKMPGGETGAHVALLGGALLTAAAFMHLHVRPSAVSAAEEAAYRAAQTAGMPDVAKLPFDLASHDGLVAERKLMTTVSGFGADTLLPFSQLNKAGKFFLSEATPAAEINRIMGTTDAIDPVRLFSGVKIGSSISERVDLAVREAERLGAFDGSRTHVLMVAPTGSGYIYPETVATLEKATGGRSVTIGMQWSDKLSAFSFSRVPYAEEFFEAMNAGFRKRIAAMPAELQPKIIGYGESLGSKALQNTFAKSGGAASVAEHGFDSVLTVGNLRSSAFRTQTVGITGHKLDATGSVFELDDVRDIDQQLTSAQQSGVKTWLLSHFGDPVNRMGNENFYRKPEWLSDRAFGTGIPRRMNYYPGITGLQGVADMYNGANLKPGDFTGIGHSYKLDVGEVVPKVLGLQVSAAQQQAIQDSNYILELARRERPLDFKSPEPWTWLTPAAK